MSDPQGGHYAEQDQAEDVVSIEARHAGTPGSPACTIECSRANENSRVPADCHAETRSRRHMRIVTLGAEDKFPHERLSLGQIAARVSAKAWVFGSSPGRAQRPPV